MNKHTAWVLGLEFNLVVIPVPQFGSLAIVIRPIVTIDQLVCVADFFGVDRPIRAVDTDSD